MYFKLLTGSALNRFMHIDLTEKTMHIILTSELIVISIFLSSTRLMFSMNMDIELVGGANVIFDLS